MYKRGRVESGEADKELKIQIRKGLIQEGPLMCHGREAAFQCGDAEVV